MIPPIYMLNFYNAIANNGVMVKPKFVKAIAKDGEIINPADARSRYDEEDEQCEKA